MSDIRARLYDFITNGTSLTTEQYEYLATDAYNEIVALQGDVEMYKQMAIKAIAKAQDEAVTVARVEALEEAAQAAKSALEHGVNPQNGGVMWRVDTVVSAIRALKDERHE